MSEQSLGPIEQYKDPNNPIYWVDDQMLVQDVRNYFWKGEEDFSLEIGFGSELTKSYLISALPCVAAEYNPDSYKNAQKLMPLTWQDVDSESIPESFRIYALKTDVGKQDLRAPKVLIYRNFSRGNVPLLTFSELGVGQRVVVILNAGHQQEQSYYEEMLQKNGYNPQFKVIAEPLLANTRLDYTPKQPAYIFDFTKEE